jgi:integrase
MNSARKIVGRAGREAGLDFQVHPHMLRHATLAQGKNKIRHHPFHPLPHYHQARRMTSAKCRSPA